MYRYAWLFDDGVNTVVMYSGWVGTFDEIDTYVTRANAEDGIDRWITEA